MSHPAPPHGLPADAVRIDAATGSGLAGRLIAYSSFEPYELADYLQALRILLPDIAIELWRMSTASLTELLQAGVEGDLILGWADTAAQSPGIAERIAPPAPGSGTDPDGFCRPTGFSLAFITDPSCLRARGADAPKIWQDLAAPQLADGILFPDPRRSGAGYLALSTILQCFGTEDGWRLMTEIDRNVRDYPGSAWAPAARTGQDGIAIGVTVRIAASRRQQEFPTLSIALPLDAVGAEAEVYGVLAASRQPALARRVLAWVMSDDAAHRFRSHAKLLLQEPEQALFAIDPLRATRERPAILQRFDELMRQRAARSPLTEGIQ
ncbi:hypothetical protein BI347_12755 [Chromobacterium sphagni]|uniref:ABC transporter substrate-binding protein n=1 Tax=Chromobacterium sphagni TaxID=1903179 RepID=A0A1S1X4E6_9NEIS|nr:ABC transporter substrate-binding protein [Chromobacterium sphagni]OHX14275.1 hypothetical protein BI347_12755 [Chromobacterium sphagni]